jgi:Protein of unknown function (DUF1638)
MKTGFIICGALGREVLDIVRKYGWDADIVAVPAVDHVFPERIATDVENKIMAMKGQYERLIVVFGDCGSKGALDETLDRLGIERIAGPHCYEMYGGDTVQQLMEEEPGTYLLTDFMVRTFNGLIMKSMGLDRYPELKKDYFGNYKRIVYLVQSPDPDLRERARIIADYLGLPLEIRETGFNYLERRLVELMDKPPT